MKTELNIVTPTILPGIKIDVVEHAVSNFRIHGMMENLSRLLIAIVEMQSNNSSATVTPGDVRSIVNQFQLIKEDLDFAIDVNDAPIGAYEQEYKCMLIDQKEIQRVRNVKLKNILKDLWLLGRIAMSCDSSKTQNFISPADETMLRRALEVCEKTLDRWVGKGVDSADLGVVVEPFVANGEIIPDVDGDWAITKEPSVGGVTSMLKDVADVDRPSTS